MQNPCLPARLRSSLGVPGLLAVSMALSLFDFARAEHYRVYFLGGQSNATGRGDASQLTEPLASPQTDVRLYTHRTLEANNAGHLAEDTWIDLAPGAGHGQLLPIYPIEFGSELSFGRAMADADPAVNIAIIKYTHGGSNLYDQWSSTGEMYATFLATAEAALSALSAAGHTYDLCGMIWHQGEADVTNNSSQYKTNLTSLVNRVRKDLFGSKPIPFVIGSISNSQYGTQITTVNNGAWRVRQAQEAVAVEMVQVGFVNTDGYPVRPGDSIHFNHQGQLSLGAGFASEILRLEAKDPDRDGLLNEQELTYGTDPNRADSDGDGHDDAIEVQAGTNPMDSNSRFVVTSSELNAAEVALTWPSVAGNTYDIQCSTDLSGWLTLQGGYPAAASGGVTTWSITQSALSALIENGVALAHYDIEGGSNGNFNTTAFDSVDVQSLTKATRLTQGGSLTGGGANSYVLTSSVFNSSPSGSPGLNVGGLLATSQENAASVGDWFGFTLQAGGNSVTYKRLEFYTNAGATTSKIDVSYTVGTTETFVLQGFTPVGGALPVELKSVDFVDFTTDQDVVWKFYLYGSTDTNQGTRFDDIKLYGLDAPMDASAEKRFFRVLLVP